MNVVTESSSSSLSPQEMLLVDPSLFDADTASILASIMMKQDNEDETSDIYDQIGQIMTPIDGDGDDDHDDEENLDIQHQQKQQFHIQPTPIGSHNQILVVPKLSAQNDTNLLSDSDVANDIRDLLRGLLLPNKNNYKDEDDDSIVGSSFNNNNTMKRRNYDYPHSVGSTTTTEEPAAKKLKTSSSSNFNKNLSTPPRRTPTILLEECKKKKGGRHTHHRRKNKWDRRLQELLDFKHTHGHCRVPNVYPENSSLAQWVKRHRHQYKLKMEPGKHSTLSDEKQRILDAVGFVWDAHGCSWMERWNELKAFFVQHGHSHVPTKYPLNRHLSIWVKCQRRQYKLYQTGGQSNMTEDRIRQLESLNFNWNPRGI